MNKLINARTSWKSIAAFSFGAFVMASCSNEVSDGPSSLAEYQAQVYNASFTEEFGQPATDHNWGFEKIDMVAATEPMGSFEFMNANGYQAPMNRAVADDVTFVQNQQYATFDDVMAVKEAKCYFYLRIDNKIQLQEMKKVMGYQSQDYYPKPGDLGNGVTDYYYSTDNEGLIDTELFNLIANVRDGGVSYATNDEPIPAELFKKAPTFETMALHVPDNAKVALAGSVENFEKNYKIFWYVAKYQNADKRIHVDGVVVPKDQITVNVPEYKTRIIVEDLKGNINSSTKVSSSDFDFNDVVFDAVTWNIDGKNHLKIIVRAAGGRLPIYVAGKEIHEGIGYMFNTYNPDYKFGKVLVQDSIISTNAKSFDFSTIPVEIEINGKRVAAGSNIGQAPEKIAVGMDYKWCKEKMSIKNVYEHFTDYVGNKTMTGWWKPTNVE